jgi:hypothetical protein
MTTPFYSSDCAANSGIQPRSGIGLCSVSAIYTTLAKLLTADVIHMVKIPAGATVLEVILDAAAMDASAALTLSVGYTGALTAFINASTVGRAGGIARMSVAGGSQKTFSADDTIQVSATAGATDTTLGAIKLTAIYTFDA